MPSWNHVAKCLRGWPQRWFCTCVSGSTTDSAPFGGAEWRGWGPAFTRQRKSSSFSGIKATLHTPLAEKEGYMAEDLIEAGSGVARRPYIKPFVRNLDVVDTEGKTISSPNESGTRFQGPS